MSPTWSNVTSEASRTYGQKWVSRLFGLVAWTLVVGLSMAVRATDATTAKKEWVVLQVSDANPITWNLALNNAKNVLAALEQDKTGTEILPYGPGINMLKADSVAANRILELAATVTQVEDATLLAMQALSQRFLSAGSGSDIVAQFEPARQLLRGLRNGIHFPDKLLGGFSVLLFYALLLRAHAAPAWLAWLGGAASLLQVFGVGEELLGVAVNYYLLAPLALLYLLTGLWLLWRGFAPSENTRSGA